MRSLGFDDVLDYTKEDFTACGRQFDLILDTRTNRSPFKYIRALNPNGTYVTVGGTTARLIQTLVLGPLIGAFTRKKVRIVALKSNKDLDYIGGLFDSGKIKPVIDGPYMLDEVPAAIQHFGRGRHQGKIIISLEHNEEVPISSGATPERRPLL